MQGCVMGRVWQQEVNDQQFASAYAPPTEHVIAIVHAQPATSSSLNPALTLTSVWGGHKAIQVAAFPAS